MLYPIESKSRSLSFLDGSWDFVKGGKNLDVDLSLIHILGDRIMILTNKPTSVREVVDVHIPHPRNIADKKFVEYRNKVTELIKWW